MVSTTHNIPALLAYNAHGKVQAGLTSAIEKLASGLRINSAADDAAGLAIAEKMRAQVRGLDRAARNSQDGISMIQTAEGALQEITSMLQRMRELSVQAANDTLTKKDRIYVQLEVNQLREEINRIGNTTQFNKKKLLDGSAGALWTSSDLATQAVINGGLREIDQFGQKSSAEGNYKITIKAEPGKGEVIKTSILVPDTELPQIPTTLSPPISPPSPVTPYTPPPNLTEVPINKPYDNEDFMNAAITYAEDMPDPFPMGAEGVIHYVDGLPYDVIIMGLKFEVTLDEDYYEEHNLTSNDPPKLLVRNIEGFYTRDDGTSGVIDGVNIVGELFPAKGALGADTVLELTSGGEVVAEMDFSVKTDDFDIFWGSVQYSWDYEYDWNDDGTPESYGGPYANYMETQAKVDITLMVGSTPYNLEAEKVAGHKIVLKDVLGGGPSTTFDFTNVTAQQLRDWVGTSPTSAGVGTLAVGPQLTGSSRAHHDQMSLGGLAVFTNSEGRSLLTAPQTVTITQGDGKQASFIIYANDTISTLAAKLNDAIGNGLGQAKYANVADMFARYVYDETTIPDAAVSTPGTIVISSVLPGQDGRLYFSGDEDFINALGLNTIRQSQETNFEVTVTDAHSGVVKAKERVTGNEFAGAMNGNADILFDAMADTRAIYNTDTGYFTLSAKNLNKGFDTYLHLVDNTTVFQIGANEGEDMGINIGDMRVTALDLNRVLVVDREAAARSVTIIDNAIDRVSMQRARLGAYQNRLEHTMNSLTAAGENLTAAESRIRDTDMAKETMNFARLNILLQSGLAMSAQANQLPQAMLSLLR